MKNERFVVSNYAIKLALAVMPAWGVVGIVQAFLLNAKFGISFGVPLLLAALAVAVFDGIAVRYNSDRGYQTETQGTVITAEAGQTIPGKVGLIEWIIIGANFILQFLLLQFGI